MFITLFLACSAEPTPPAAKPGPVATPAEAAPAPKAPTVGKVDAVTLKADLAANKVPILVDVRTPAEFAEGRVPGAKSIPIDELASRTSELEAYRQGPVYLICASGGRSARGAALLASQGFQAVNVGDGTSGWVAAGFPVER